MKFPRFIGLTVQRSTCFRTLTTESPKPFKDMPGLNALPIIGILHHFLPIVGTVGFKSNIFEMFTVFKEKFGSIVKWEGAFSRGALVVMFEPKDFDQVFRAEESNPLRPGFESLEYYREVLHKEKYAGVYGLTTAQGEQWRDFRTKVNPALLKIKLIKLYAPGLTDIAGESITRLLKMSPDAIAKDFDAEATKWSLESVALVALGTRIGCVADNSDDHPGKKLIYCSRNVADLSFKLEFLPSPFRRNKTQSPNFKKIIEVFDMQWDISQMYISQTQKKIEERGHDIPEEDQSILEKLLAIDERVAVMMANEMLMAGIDTVAFALTGLLYQLAVNQEVQNKVRDEIRQKKSTRYLKACLKESLRLAPVIPGNLRMTTREHIVGGHVIPKGVSVIAPNEVLSKSEDHYPRANEFIPERWIVDKSDPLYHGNTHPMVTLPFGFGVRSCIGRRIAELELETFVKTLLEKVKVTWNGPPLRIKTKILNEYRRPFSFKFEPIE